ncbi:MAG: SDR family NAD(P)-dependent oxidoreductase [Desertimonas sp.]
MGRLQDKVAIITGGARGQGRAEAARFAEEGAKVVITDVLADAGAATAAELGISFVRHDVTSSESWAGVVDATLAAHGRIDVLVNNAGIFERVRLVDTDEEQYRRTIEVNQFGVFFGLKAVVPTMIAQEAGSIINISSVAGLRSAAGAFAYGASKFAVTGMTRTAAAELARHHIRVNSIHPGLIDTAMMDEMRTDGRDRVATMASRVPLGRVADADEVATLAVFLASDESGYVTGAQLVVDGGMTA